MTVYVKEQVGAITERPDLFAAALDNVGMSDDLWAELQVNGPLNVVEFGTVKNEKEFHDLLGAGHGWLARRPRAPTDLPKF